MRRTAPGDLPSLISLSRRIYPADPWTHGQLSRQLEVFPAGQRVAVDPASGALVGMASSLIVRWDDYEVEGSWRDFTDAGFFTNHDPAGRTLYGAEVLVDPRQRRRGIGSALYDAREALVERLGLDRIRAGARLAGYADHADRMDAREYAAKVVAGELSDPTLSFQLARGFRVLAVVPEYLPRDPGSRGWAAVVEWRPRRGRRIGER